MAADERRRPPFRLATGTVRRFNGGLFCDADSLPITAEMPTELHRAAGCDWTWVEPAIFGTLLEQALDPAERTRLGAHYTPRAYVERLVEPTIIEPLSQDWDEAQQEARGLIDRDREGEVLARVRAFHPQLCATRVLDPACGSGNFLYAAMESMKRLEGEVPDMIELLGGQAQLEIESHAVDPHQFLGIELNPRTKAIAELVLWIGFIQWQLRADGQDVIRDPVLRDFKTVECRNAMLEWHKCEPLRDADGKPVTRWDGRTHKRHPITQAGIPDETARVGVQRYTNPRPATWPEAEFIGGKDLRTELGDGYAEALWDSREDRKANRKMPGGADFVLYWWDRAAELIRTGKFRRFGLIAANSITQVFGQKVLPRHMQHDKQPLSLVYAVPDHLWVTGKDRAAARIAITVGAPGRIEGRLNHVASERDLDTDSPVVELTAQDESIGPRLRIGANVSAARPLKVNARLCTLGVKLHSAGFVVTPAWVLGLGSVAGLEHHILPYRNGRDMNQPSRGVMAIDLYPLREADVRQQFPAVYQHVRERVWPERRENRMGFRRNNWWRFGATHETLRNGIRDLIRFIAMAETSKHRFSGSCPRAPARTTCSSASHTTTPTSSACFRPPFIWPGRSLPAGASTPGLTTARPAPSIPSLFPTPTGCSRPASAPLRSSWTLCAKIGSLPSLPSL